MRPLNDYESLKTPKGRKELGLFLLEGPRFVCDWITGGGEVEVILCDKNSADALRVSCHAVFAMMAPRILDHGSFLRISDTVHSQGVVAVAPIPSFAPFDQGAILALNGVQDPGNVGTILRSGVALGVERFLFDSACADPYAPKTVRSSGGAISKAKIQRTGDLAGDLGKMKKAGFQIYAIDVGGQSRVDDLARAPGNTVLIVGSEGQGIDFPLLNLADQRVRIPICSVESLNVSAAAAIALYILNKKKSVP